MIRLLIRNGKLTIIGVVLSVSVGFFIVYVSLEFIPWMLGKILGLTIGLGIAAIGGFSGRAHALDIHPPFTNDPLGWRKAKESYKKEETAVKKTADPDSED